MKHTVSPFCTFLLEKKSTKRKLHKQSKQNRRGRQKAVCTRKHRAWQAALPPFSFGKEKYQKKTTPLGLDVIRCKTVGIVSDGFVLRLI